jgi:glycosyltransferase involved in cell wall biosynthesis
MKREALSLLLASDTYHPDTNGAAYFSYRLATLLVKRGHEVSVICPSRGFRQRTVCQAGVRVFGVRSLPLLIYPNFRFSPPFLAKPSIRKFLRLHRPDVVHIQNYFLLSNAVFEVAQELDIPIVGTNHMVPENVSHHLHFSPRMETKVARYLWYRFVQIYKHLDAVTAPTPTAATLSQRPGLGKEVIPLSCGVDLRYFCPGEPDGKLKEEYRIPGRRILLYAGRLDKEKRIEVIISALPAIVERVDAHLVVAGTGKLRRALESLVADLGIRERVTFTGYIPDDELRRFYRSAHLFVMAGTSELQSIVTMEAMASGLPVIAAHALALPELVHDGENGFLFPPDDSRSLAAAAIRILSDEALRTAMAAKSLEIIQRHDIDTVVAAFESLYSKVLGSR